MLNFFTKTLFNSKLKIMADLAALLLLVEGPYG
jgi:hypothetical protein